jgi:hypothetical protein
LFWWGATPSPLAWTRWFVWESGLDRCSYCESAAPWNGVSFWRRRLLSTQTLLATCFDLPLEGGTNAFWCQRTLEKLFGLRLWSHGVD